MDDVCISPLPNILASSAPLYQPHKYFVFSFQKSQSILTDMFFQLVIQPYSVCVIQIKNCINVMAPKIKDKIMLNTEIAFCFLLFFSFSKTLSCNTLISIAS